MLRRLEPILRGSCDAMLLFDGVTGALLDLGEAASALFGHTSAPALDVICEPAPPYDAEAMRALVGLARAQGLARGEARFVRADGAPLWLDLRLRADTIDGRDVVIAFGFDVTDRKLADAELRRTRAFLEAAIRQSGVGILIMQKSSPTTTLANRAAREILGVVDVDESSPLEVAAAWPRICRDGVELPPDEFPVMRAYTHGEVVAAEEIEIERGEGDVRTVICSAGPVIDDEGVLQGSIVLFPDVTEWKRSEANVRERDRLLQIFHDQIRDAVYAIDATGRIDYVTPSVEHLTRRPKESLLGKTLEESGIVGPASLEEALSDLAHVLAGNALSARDYAYVTGWGEDCVGEVTGSPLLDEDDNPRALFVVRDVTARRREAADRDAREAQTRQGQKLEALGTLAAGFAHEMNNPLTGILNLAELIELELVTAEGMKDVALRIKSLCERMTTTVRNLLSFAASDSRTTRAVSLVDIVDMTLELAAPRLKRDGVTCTRRVTSRELPEIEGRPSELQQLVLILLTNACDAVRALPEVTPERRAIEIVVDRVEDPTGNAGASISMSDHGVGIPEDVAYRVFDPFFTTKPPDKGVGLGLWVARGIARDHGGTLALETKVGVGTTFRLVLPGASHAAEDR